MWKTGWPEQGSPIKWWRKWGDRMGLWVFVLFHCVLCLIAAILIYTHLLKSSPMILPIVFLVPVFGFACLLFLEWESRGDQENKKEVGIEKLKINDEIHRSILMEEDPARDLMVPLQEALLMNDASTRRELMMDILYDDAGDYVEVLKNARMNDDTEVVHYATTAMVELQKDYEMKLQKQKDVFAREEDPGILEEYIQTLDKYVGSGLLEGNMLRNRRLELCDLLERKLMQQKEEGREELSLYCKKFEQDCALGEYEDALLLADAAIRLRPAQEEGYLMKIRHGVMVKDPKQIGMVIGLLEKNKVYLSPSARRTVEFWKENDETEN